MYIIRTLYDDGFELKTVFAYELRDGELVIDETRVNEGFMKFLCDGMHAKFTRQDNGALTAPVHYHDVFEEMFQSLPYVLNDEEALKALSENVVECHNSSPPQHVA